MNGDEIIIGVDCGGTFTDAVEIGRASCRERV